MKKLVGGLGILTIAVLAAVLPATQPTAAPVVHASVAIRTNVNFETRFHQFALNADMRGMFIHRESVPNTPFNHNDVFTGAIYLNEQSFAVALVNPTGGTREWRFDVVQFQNGQWVESDAFNISRSGSFVNYEFRKSLTPGLYGIRARWYREVGTGENAVWIPEQVWGNLEMQQDAQVIYEILLGEEIQFLNGSFNGHSVVTRGNIPRVLHLQLHTNNGAMDMSQLSVGQRSSGFALGPLFQDVQINASQLNIEVLRNGQVIPGTVVQAHGWGNNIMVEFLSTPSYAQYLVRFTHPADTTVQGAFLIDNTTRRNFTQTDNSGAVAALFVLGTLLAIGATALFLAPKLIIKNQERKYAKLQNARYMEGDGSRVDKAYKAQSAVDAAKGARELASRTRGGGFLDSIRESRARREMARDQGLTMEQFKELEAKHKELERAQAASLSDFRAAIEEKVAIKPEVQSHDYTPDDGFEMLESVGQQALVTDEQVVQTVVQPNIAGEGSILSRLRNMTGDDAQTRRVEIAPTAPEPQPVPLVDEPAPIKEEAPEPAPTSNILSRLKKFTED